MRKFRERYLGMDVCGTDLGYDWMDSITVYCRKSYEGNNYPDIANCLEELESDYIIRQAVLDTKLIRSLLLEEYTEGKKE